MSEPQTVTATEASRSFSDLLHRVCYSGESFIVKKGHRLMARIVPVEQVEAKKPVKFIEPAVQVEIEETQALPPEETIPEETMMEAAEAVEQQLEPVVENIYETTSSDLLPVIDIDGTIPDGVTPEEAEYYRSIIEQISKSTLETCE